MTAPFMNTALIELVSTAIVSADPLRLDRQCSADQSLQSRAFINGAVIGRLFAVM